jgi:MYXO-CTERM domain-containing protein
MKPTTRRPALLLLTVVAILGIAAHASPAKSAGVLAHRTPRGAMAIRARGPSPGAPVPTAPSGRLVYHGGRVISNVKVYQVLWGPNVWSRMASEMAGFYAAVTNSEYIDWLGSQYDTVGRKSSVDGVTTSNQHIGRGSFGGKFTITPNDTSTTLTTASIATELAYQIAHGTLPQPDLDADGNVDALYMFDFPPGLTMWLDNEQGCVQWYAYHYTTTIGGKSVPYGVHPDFSQDCANGDFTLATSVHSHELIEAITDMEVGLNDDVKVAWNSDQDNGEEIGDLCNTDGIIGGYTVQTIWSNHDNACVTTSAFRLPLCNGTLQAPSCRPCSAIDNGVACTGATPLCETDHASIKHGLCVSCTADSGCSGATPICDKSATQTADTCRACASDADCSGATPACVTSASDPKKGQCVGCTSNASCTAPTAVCDTSSDTCVECSTNADCKDASKPVCSAHACVGGIGHPTPGSDGGARPGADGGAPNGADPGAGASDSGGSDASGCGCTTIGRASNGAAGVGLVILLGLALRRRERA